MVFAGLHWCPTLKVCLLSMMGDLSLETIATRVGFFNARWHNREIASPAAYFSTMLEVKMVEALRSAEKYILSAQRSPAHKWHTARSVDKFGVTWHPLAWDPDRRGAVAHIDGCWLFRGR